MTDTGRSGEGLVPGPIEVVRSGGIAGFTRRASLDPADLDPAEVTDIERLVAEGQAHASHETSRHRRGADRFSYEVTMTTGEDRRSVTLAEEDLSPEIRRLLDKLLVIERQ